jgi:hypothetical protein
MTLGKEEIQKIVLGVILLIGLIYCYFTMLLGPLQDGHAASRKRIEEMNAKLNEAKSQITKTQQLEKTAPEAKVMVKQIEALIPDGSPVAWFPVRVGDFFRQYGFDKATTKMTNDVVDKELPGFRLSSWNVDIAKADFNAFGQALAGFENEELLVEISKLEVEFLKGDPDLQHVVLNLNNIVKP